MRNVAVVHAIYQSDLAGDPENPRKRARQLCAESQDAGAIQAPTEQHVQGECAAISETDHHETREIEPVVAQLLCDQRLEMTHRAIKHGWLAPPAGGLGK